MRIIRPGEFSIQRYPNVFFHFGRPRAVGRWKLQEECNASQRNAMMKLHEGEGGLERLDMFFVFLVLLFKPFYYLVLLFFWDSNIGDLKSVWLLDFGGTRHYSTVIWISTFLGSCFFAFFYHLLGLFFVFSFCLLFTMFVHGFCVPPFCWTQGVGWRDFLTTGGQILYTTSELDIWIRFFIR